MKTYRSRQLSLGLCFTVGAALLTAAAQAADEPVPTLVVRYADLNTGSSAGAAALLHRIEAAARQVCRLDVQSDLHLLGKEKACFKRAVDEAVLHVDAPLLTALHGSTSMRLASR